MKKKIKGYLLSIIMLCLLVVTTGSVYAADTPTPKYRHRMTGGISNIYIYIDGKGQHRATYWQNLIKTAVNNWMYTGVGANKFYCKGYVSDGHSGSKIDFYGASPFHFLEPDEVLGETTFYRYDESQFNPVDSDNWYSAKITINDVLLQSNQYSNDDAILFFIHEIGHAFGLGHNTSNRYSVMHDWVNNCPVKRVQKVDNDALNEMY